MFIKTKEIENWLVSRKREIPVRIQKIKFSELDQWSFESGTGNLKHESGKFFSIIGFDVQTNWGPIDHWTQPIIKQPEIGFLGIITKKIDGKLYCLMQAKIEPGNLNYVQLSPTIQATKSNYTQVHKGKRSLYLEYFIGSLHSQIEDTTSTYYKGVGKRKVYFPRSIAGHRLRYSLTDRISFSAIETVIFGNRKIDEHYLLPFIPFWSMQHSIGDLDNVQMCGELIWSGQNDLNIYASLFVDEWRPEWTFKDNNRNWIGYQIGMKKSLERTHLILH